MIYPGSPCGLWVQRVVLKATALFKDLRGFQLRSGQRQWKRNSSLRAWHSRILGVGQQGKAVWIGTVASSQCSQLGLQLNCKLKINSVSELAQQEREMTFGKHPLTLTFERTLLPLILTSDDLYTLCVFPSLWNLGPSAPVSNWTVWLESHGVATEIRRDQLPQALKPSQAEIVAVPQDAGAQQLPRCTTGTQAGEGHDQCEWSWTRPLWLLLCIEGQASTWEQEMRHEDDWEKGQWYTLIS